MRNRAAETRADSSGKVNHPVASSPDVDAYDGYGETKLIWAARLGELQRLGDLIALGANPNLTGSDCKNAMSRAIEAGHLACVEALIAAGADVNAKAGYTPATLLEFTLEKRQVQCAKALIAAGADVNAKAAYSGTTMLVLALEKGLLQCVEALIATGANLDERDHLSGTALMRAAEKGDADCVKALIEGGADLDLQTSRYRRLSAIMMASEEGHVDCVKALIDAGADLNLEDEYGNTALLYAAQKHRWDCAGALITAGARDDTDSQAFMKAARSGDLDCVRAFIAAGADVNAKDNKGNSVLMNAHASVRRLLRNAGGKITSRHFLREAGKAGIVAGVALAWAAVALGIGALVHWLSPLLTIWGAGILGALSTPFIVFFAGVLAGQTDYSAYRRIMLLGWATLSLVMAILLHWLCPWFPTWAAAGLVGVLAAPIACPLALLLPEPAPSSSRGQAKTKDVAGKLPTEQMPGGSSGGGMRVIGDEQKYQKSMKCQYPGCGLTAMQARPYCFDHFNDRPELNALRAAKRRGYSAVDFLHDVAQVSKRYWWLCVGVACGVAAAFHFLLPPHPMWVDLLTALVDSFFLPWSVFSVHSIMGQRRYQAATLPPGGASMTIIGWAIGGAGFAVLTFRVLPSVLVWMAIILGVVAATVVVGIITYVRDVIWIYR